MGTNHVKVETTTKKKSENRNGKVGTNHREVETNHEKKETATAKWEQTEWGVCDIWEKITGRWNETPVRWREKKNNGVVGTNHSKMVVNRGELETKHSEVGSPRSYVCSIRHVSF